MKINEISRGQWKAYGGVLDEAKAHGEEVLVEWDQCCSAEVPRGMRRMRLVPSVEVAKKRKDIVVGEDEKGSYCGTIGVKRSLKMGWWIIEADN